MAGFRIHSQDPDNIQLLTFDLSTVDTSNAKLESPTKVKCATDMDTEVDVHKAFDTALQLHCADTPPYRLRPFTCFRLSIFET